MLRDGNLGKTLKDGDEARAIMAGGSVRGHHRWKKKLPMRNEPRKCYSCGKVGHIVRNCFARDGQIHRMTFPTKRRRSRAWGGVSRHSYCWQGVQVHTKVRFVPVRAPKAERTLTDSVSFPHVFIGPCVCLVSLFPGCCAQHSV